MFCLSIVLKVESHRTRFYILQWQLGFFNTSCHAGGLWVMMHDMNSSSSACSHTHTHVVIHHVSCALHLLSPLHYQIFTKGRTSNQECQFPVKKNSVKVMDAPLSFVLMSPLTVRFVLLRPTDSESLTWVMCRVIPSTTVEIKKLVPGAFAHPTTEESPREILWRAEERKLIVKVNVTPSKDKRAPKVGKGRGVWAEGRIERDKWR